MVSFAQNNVISSGYRCWGDELEENYRVCEYENLLMHNGLFYLINTTRPPRVQNSWLEDTFGFISGNLGWFQPESIHNFTENFTEISRGLIWLMSYENSHYRMLNENLPNMHVSLCKYWNYCKINETDVYIVTTNRFDVDEYSENTILALKSISKYPVIRSGHPDFKDKNILIHRALAGVGSECNAYAECSDYKLCKICKRKTPKFELMELWQTRIHSHLGIIFKEKKKKKINFLVVNRQMNQGRYIVNTKELVDNISRIHGRRLNITSVTLDNTTLLQQALWYSSADVIVQTNGESLGNLVFISPTSILIDIVVTPFTEYLNISRSINYIYQSKWKLVSLPGKNYSLILDFLFRIQSDKYSLEWTNMSQNDKANFICFGICPKDNIICNNHWTYKYAVIKIDIDKVNIVLKKLISGKNIYLP